MYDLERHKPSSRAHGMFDTASLAFLSLAKFVHMNSLGLMGNVVLLSSLLSVCGGKPLNKCEIHGQLHEHEHPSLHHWLDSSFSIKCGQFKAHG